MHRSLVIVVNDTFPVLAPAISSRLRSCFTLTLVRGWRTRRLCQFYALQTNSRNRSYPVNTKEGGEGSGQRIYVKTHCMDPKAGLRGDHEHAS